MKVETIDPLEIKEIREQSPNVVTMSRDAARALFDIIEDGMTDDSFEDLTTEIDLCQGADSKPAYLIIKITE